MRLDLPNKQARVFGKKHRAFGNKCRQMPRLLEKLLKSEI